jgi:hypothetical protein
MPRVRVPRHVTQLVTRLIAPLVVDYFASAARPVPQHVARLVTRLVAPLVVDYSTSHSLVVDYSVRRDFILRPHWLYFSHAVGRDYLSRGNTVSTSSTPRAATTSSSGRIASTIHLD